MQFDYIKIASCSFGDWPLINKIAQFDLPIIASTGGCSLDTIDKVVSFFVHRNKDISLLHCIGEYPTSMDHAELNQIDLFKKRYPNLRVGWSTHENPNDFITSCLAIAKGANIIEKHVGIETETYKLNSYSINPQLAEIWLIWCSNCLLSCGIENERSDKNLKECSDLRQFQRGIFVNRNIKIGEEISKNDVFYAWPVSENGITTKEASKYAKLITIKNIPKNSEINYDNVKIENTREKVWDIVQEVKTFLLKSGVVFPGQAQLEISHHYGLDNFHKTGITMLTVINREYCKKLIVVLPGQNHPEQYHKVKE